MRLFGRRSAIDRRLQQTTGLLAIAAVKRRDTVLQQLFRLALPLGERAARPLDVGTRPGMAPVEEQRARPHVDGELVAGGEVVIEAIEQELLDFRVAIRTGRRAVRARIVRTKRIGHRDYREPRRL